MLGDVAFGDRDEAGEPRFRRQQIVERGVQTARALRVGEAIADREDSATTIVQKLEPHPVCEGGGPLGESNENVMRWSCRRAVQRRDAVGDGPGPETDLIRDLR